MNPGLEKSASAASAGGAEGETRETYKLKEARLFGDEPQPWRKVAKDTFPGNPVPSMINEDESQLLHWLARDWVRGEGQIVDLGPLAGASTYALASGLSANDTCTDKNGRIHSYDNWVFYEDWARFFPGEKLVQGQDIQKHFLRYIRPFSDYVIPHKGDLHTFSWGEENIELLFIDVAKVPSLMAHIVNEFFPRLIPNRSIVIHQDFISAECPWIHIAMDCLRDYFAMLDSPEGGSVCYMPVKKVPENFLTADFFDSMALDEARKRLADARANIRGWYHLCVWLAEAHYLAMSGERNDAKEIVRQVKAHQSFEPGVQYDVDLVNSRIELGGLTYASRNAAVRFFAWFGRQLRRISTG